MEFTNRYGLPDTIIRAVRKRDANYNSKADRSVTQLIGPPQIDILRKAHFKEMTKDVSDDMYALLGSAVHQILEWGAGDNTAEERLFATIRGWTVSGAIDLQQEGDKLSIIDYKVCAAYSLLKNDGNKPEWEAQLNCYAYLLWLNKGVQPSSIKVCAIIRDWSRRDAADPFYPPAPIVLIDLPLWSVERQEAYIKNRIDLHQDAAMKFELDQPLPECTPDERWSTGDRWSVTKPGGKRASRTFPTEDEARSYAAEREFPDTSVEFKPGRSVRCAYCQVSEWCQQYANMTEQEKPNGE